VRTAVWKVYVGANAEEFPKDPLASAKIAFGSEDAYFDDQNYAQYRILIKKGEIVYSFERWFRVIFLDDDTTTIEEAKLYLTGSTAPGAYFRIGTSASYRKPSNVLNPETSLKTFGFPNGPNEIVPTNPSTWLSVRVYKQGSVFVTDYIVAQLVLDGNYLQTLNVLNDVRFHLWYREV